MYQLSRFLGAAVMAMAMLPMASSAQNYPAKPITIIVPFPAGGTLDGLTRSLGQEMSKHWKQPVIVDNKPGGGTIIGTQALARSKPDGYTFGMVANSFTINPFLHQNMSYDTAKDFVPISMVAYTPHILVAHPSVPVKTLQDVLKAAQAKPGKLSFASFGTGTSPHIAVELLKSKTNVDVLHVPYKGQAPALNDLLGGHVDLMFANAPDVLPHIVSGKLRAIAVVNAKRMDSLPDVPTFKEAGIADFESNSWFGAVAPANTPAGIVQSINAELVRIINLPEMRERLAAQGLVPAGTTAREFTAYLKAEMDKSERMIKASGASID